MLRLAVLFLLGNVLPGWSFCLTLYVSPSGLAGNDGLARTQASAQRGPMSSIDNALAALRLAKARRSDGELDRIVLLPGTYPLTQAVKLTPSDSGLAANMPLVIEAEKAGSVTLSGAASLAGFQPVVGQQYVSLQTKLPKAFHTMWVNEQRATLARSPNQGAYFVGGKNVATPVPGDRFFKPKLPANVDNTKRIVLPEAAQQELSKATKQGTLDGAVLIAMHAWNSSAQSVSAFDADSGVASVSPDSWWPFLKFGPDQRFALQGLAAFLDEPGEWWRSESGELRYWPDPKQKLSLLKAMAPQLDRLVDLSGQPNNPVQHVTLKGLRFAYTDAVTSPFIDSQAALSTPAAVSMSYARHNTVEGCVFEHTGGYGLAMRQGSQSNLVKATVFRDLGAGAIRIGEPSISTNEFDLVEGNRVEDNLIEDNGKLFPGAIGIWIGQSSGNVVAHNEIRRTSYSGISVGWTWGFGPSKAQRNVIEYNFLHDIGQGQLSDLGAIYALGVSDGTAIRHNRIEDVRSYRKAGSSAWGIYLDEGASRIVVENNMVQRTTGGGLHLHYGHDNVVRNNVFANSDIAQARRSKKTDSRLVFESNLLIAGDAPLFEREWSDPDVISRNNIFVTSKPNEIRQKLSLSGLRALGLEEGSEVLNTSEVPCSAVLCRPPLARIKHTGFRVFGVQEAGVSAGVKLLH